MNSIKVNNITVVSVDNKPKFNSSNLINSNTVYHLTERLHPMFSNKLDFTDGAYYRWDTQKYVTTDGNVLTGFILVYEGQKILVNISPDDSVTNTISTFDKDFNIVWDKCVGGNLVNFMFTVPEGIEYIRFGTRSNKSSDYIGRAKVEFENSFTTTIEETMTNLANPENIFEGYVNNIGGINTNPTDTKGIARTIVIYVEGGKTISFGNYFMGSSDTAYFAFYNNNSMVQNNYLHELVAENIKIENIAVPAIANKVYINLRLANSQEPESAYAEFMCNYGEKLLPYEPYEPYIKTINDKVVKDYTNDINQIKNDTSICDNFTDVNNKLYYKGQPIASETSISTLVADLPISDGTDISTGYAYIDNNTSTIKVKR